MPKYAFVLHARLLDLLSKQLVTKDVRALIELVKNSYDADATAVQIEWSGESSTLTIRDNGNGMGLDAIKSGWLTLGTPMKARKTKSPAGRKYTGSKGLGRMSVGHLGETATIETSAKDGKWRKFAFNIEDLNKQVSKGADPSVNVNSTSRPEDALDDKGTIIRIKTKAEFVASEASHDEYVRELRLLRHPRFNTLSKRPFEVHFKSPFGSASPVDRVDVEEPVPIRVTAKITGQKTGLVSVEHQAKLYQGAEKISDWKDYDLTGDYDLIQGTKIEILWRPRGASPKDTPAWTRSAKDTLADAYGFHIFRDLVRVQPYGDPDQDWLRLEETYVALGASKRHPRPIQIFGWAEISRANDFHDNASREGLQNNEAFRQLRKFCLQAIETLRDFRQKAEPETKGEVAPAATEGSVKEAKATLSRLAKKLGQDKAAKQDVVQMQTFVQQFQDQRSQLAMYRERTSAGLVSSLILHDSGISLADQVEIMEEARKLACSQPAHALVLKSLSPIIGRVIDGYELLRGAGKTGGYRVQPFNATESIRTIVDHMNSVLDRALVIDFQAENLTVNMREADLWSVMVNLLHNAITVDEYNHSAGRDFPPARHIVISTTLVDGDYILQVDDNGPGLPNKPDGWIWERDNSTRGTEGGSGLGLWIVQDIARGMGGWATAAATKKFGTGAEFRIAFPGVGAK